MTDKSLLCKTSDQLPRSTCLEAAVDSRHTSSTGCASSDLEFSTRIFRELATCTLGNAILQTSRYDGKCQGTKVSLLIFLDTNAMTMYAILCASVQY